MGVSFIFYASYCNPAADDLHSGIAETYQATLSVNPGGFLSQKLCSIVYQIH